MKRKRYEEEEIQNQRVSVKAKTLTESQLLGEIIGEGIQGRAFLVHWIVLKQTQPIWRVIFLEQS